MKFNENLWQANFWMMFTFEVGQSLLLVIPATIRTAKQDAWISILIAGG